TPASSAARLLGRNEGMIEVDSDAYRASVIIITESPRFKDFALFGLCIPADLPVPGCTTCPFEIC
ncbi:MAG TPA: hypothetical protein VIO38_17695, partial [Rariglobus sp.]